MKQAIIRHDIDVLNERINAIDRRIRHLEKLKNKYANRKRRLLNVK